MKTLICLLKDRSGATAIEYGLIAALISLGLIAGIGAFSDALLAMFQKITNTIIGAGTL